MNPVVAHASGADETMSLVMLFAGIWVGWIGWSRLRGTAAEKYCPCGAGTGFSIPPSSCAFLAIFGFMLCRFC